jgi:hypothetical protein
VADPALFQQLADRHGHYCPMSTLGVRLAEAACERILLIALNDWKFSYLARTCATDGIRIIFEQYQPDFELLVEAQGQHRLHCREPNGVQIAFALTEQALQLAAGYRELPEDQQPMRLEELRTMQIRQLIEVTEG